MVARRNLVISLILIVSFLLAAFTDLLPQTSSPAEEYAEIVEKYREVIHDQMRKQGITGFAIALVTDKEVLWTEGFGYTDRTYQTQVTEDTPFSIQSMSKSITATAVLLAVQEGLVDLDVPISTYLPDFTVHSIFDDHPQDIITLRMLLSHTAGFTHEAPVGNNYDLEPGTWVTHIASISDTWLKYPVGQGYSYSNLGIDLAGYILDQVAEMPFHLYAKTHLFEPLGMKNSTFDIDEIAGLENRAIGQSAIFRDIPSITTIIPSGGVNTSASDMARYLQFHINRGNFSGQTLLDPQFIEEMYKPHFQASEAARYGLGLDLRRGRFDAIRIVHSGGGFGFMSQMAWYPDLKIGITWLSTSEENEHDLLGWLSNAILDDLIDTSPEVYASRAQVHQYTASAIPSIPALLSETQLIKSIQQSALEPDELQQKRWMEYDGWYSIKKWGQTIAIVRVRAGDQLEFNGFPVVEVKPGLFFALDGEAIDFRHAIPTVSNIKMEKDNGTLQPQSILLRMCGIGFTLTILWTVTEFTGRMIRRRKKKGMPPSRLNWLTAATRIAITLASLLGLGTLPMLFKFPILYFSGTPLPQEGMHIEMRLGFSMVYAAAGLTLLSLLGLALSWSKSLDSRLNRIMASVFTGILALFSLLVLS